MNRYRHIEKIVENQNNRNAAHSQIMSNYLAKMKLKP